MQKLLLFIVIILLSGDLHVQNINFFLNMQCGYNVATIKASFQKLLTVADVKVMFTSFLYGNLIQWRKEN